MMKEKLLFVIDPVTKKLSSISDERMPEVTFHMIWPFLQGLHKRASFLRQIVLGPGGKSGANSLFQISVEILVRVIFRGIRRKIKHFYLFSVGLKPLSHDLTMMHPMIIQDQEDLPLNIHDQARKKLQQHLGRHRLAIQHKPNFALIGYSRDHIYTASLGVEFNNWSFSFGSITSGVESFIVYACFIPQ
jgi:hypothetical protein